MLQLYAAISSVTDELKYAFSICHIVSMKQFDKQYLVQA